MEEHSVIEEINVCPEDALQKSRDMLRNVVATPQQPKKGATKKDLIDKIKVLHEKSKVPFVESRFTRLNKTQLESKLGEMIDKGVSSLVDKREKDACEESRKKVAEILGEDVEPECKSEKIKNPTDPDQGSKALFLLNHTFAKGIEALSSSEKNSFGIQVDGYSGHLEECKDELLEAYRDIYEEYTEELQAFVNPINRVVLINGVGLCGAIKRDIKKNSE